MIPIHNFDLRKISPIRGINSKMKSMPVLTPYVDKEIGKIVPEQNIESPQPIIEAVKKDSKLWNPSVKLNSRQGPRRSPVMGNDPINKCLQPRNKKFEYDVKSLRAPQYDLKNGASRGFEFVS